MVTGDVKHYLSFFIEKKYENINACSSVSADVTLGF